MQRILLEDLCKTSCLWDYNRIAVGQAGEGTLVDFPTKQTTKEELGQKLFIKSDVRNHKH